MKPTNAPAIDASQLHAMQTPTSHCNQRALPDASHASRKVWRVAAITAVFMVVEIVYGVTTHSMALLADGWHMCTHVIALGIAGIAYKLSARFSRDPRYAALFCWGTWKIEILGSFASALLLLGVAVAMVIEAAQRFVAPAPIAFDQALVVATIGLALNIVSAWMLAGDPSHHGHSHGADQAHDDHAHGHGHGHGHDAAHAQPRDTARAAPRGTDLNLRAAYAHVVADAATSVLAIIALGAGRWFSIVWLDPVVALVGAAIIASWSFGLLRDSGRILLDAEMNADLVRRVRDALEVEHARLVDLHVWRVGPAAYSVALSVQSDAPLAPADLRARLDAHAEIVHATIEIEPVAKLA